MKTFVSFAVDAADNIFVINEGKIFLWSHKSDTTVFFAESFSAFFETLHD